MEAKVKRPSGGALIKAKPPRGKRLNVLMVEDVDDDAVLVARHLQSHGYDLHYRRVDTTDSMRAALNEKAWDIILLDYELPEFNGIAALKILKDNRLDVPVIVVTGTVNEEKAAKIMNAGACDLVLKSNLGRLVPAIERELEAARLRWHKTQAEQLLRMQQNMLDNLMANIPDSIYFKDTEHRYIHLNHAELTLLNADRPEAVVGKPADAFLPPDRAGMREEEENKLFATGEPLIDRVEKAAQKDGTVRWYSATKAPIRDERGKIVGLVGITRDVTRVKHAEGALRESEAFFRAIVDYAPGALVIKDLDGRNLLANKTFCSWYKTAAINIVGKTHDQFLSEQASERVKAQERQVIETRAPVQEERRVNYPDGVARDVLVQKFPILGDDGNIRAIGTLITNISKRKRVEAALRESEERFRAILESLPTAVSLKDRDGRYLVVNKTLASWFGTGAEEIVGRKISDFYSEEEAKQISIVDREVFESGKGKVLETKRLFPDGSVRHIMVYRCPMRSAAGEVISISTIDTDITDIRKAESEIRKLSSVVEQSPASVIITDTEGVIDYVNQAFTEITGYTAEESIAKTSYFLKSGDTPSETIADMWSTIRAGKAWRGTFHNRKKDGTSFLAGTTIFPIAGDDGRITQFVATQQDITERIDEQKRLKQAEKMESLGSLAGGIAHDFNNMLLPILALTNLTLRKLPDDSEHREKLEKVVQAATRAKDLVAQILAFSRQEESQQKNIDVDAVINEILGLLRNTLPSTIKLETDLGLNGGQILADAAQIGTVLLNLASNAGDSMDGKPGTLKVSLTRADIGEKRNGMPESLKPGCYAKIQIKDTGHGMDEETVKRIFEPFFTTKAVGKGTGLGLATAYGIISKHGGIIDVASQIGVGTTFDIYLPLVEENAK